MICRVTIDLASKISGLCLSMDNEIQKLEIMEDDYDPDGSIARWLKRITAFIGHPNKFDRLIVGIELTNFKSALVSTKHHYLAGGIVGIIKAYYPKANIKLFNSNQWQAMRLNATPRMVREDRKALSVKIAREELGNRFGYIDDNMADAYNINRVLDSLQSSYEIHEEKIRMTKETSKLKEKQHAARKRIIKLQEKLMTLDKVRNKKLIARLEQEIFDLKAGL